MPRLRHRRRDEPPRHIGPSGRPDSEQRCWKCGKLLQTFDALHARKLLQMAGAMIRCPRCYENNKA